MITNVHVWLTLQGETFSPDEAQRVTGLPLERAIEPGEVGLWGRFRGQPVPYGTAYFMAPDHVSSVDKLVWLLDRTLPHSARLLKLGASRLEVWAVYGWRDQCNLAFTADELEKLARLGADFCVDCYEDR